MDSSYIYYEPNDTLFVLIYKLGEGNQEIWFALEYKQFLQQIKNKKQIITTKALKIFTPDNAKYAEREINIQTTLKKNNTHHNNINYPIGHFKCINTDKSELTVVLYDVMIGSLYDIQYKIHEFPNDAIHKMIGQMVNAMYFIHDCGYIHSDLKLDNILLVGNTKMQKDIVTFANTYNLINKIPKSITKKNIHNLIPKIVDTFADCVTKKFDLYDLINDYSTDGSSSESGSENDTTESSHSESEEEDGNNNDTKSIEDYAKTESYTEEDDNITVSTYRSSKGRYTEDYNMFHVQYVLNKLNEKEVTPSKHVASKLTEEQLDILTALKNPIVKITDFDLLIKHDVEKYTRCLRLFRAPEIVLGMNYGKEIDYWALGNLIFELVTENLIIDVDGDALCDVYDRDFVNVKLFFEKMCWEKRSNIDLLNMIKLSKRKDYLINADGTMKYINGFRNDFWVNKVSDEKIKNLLVGLLKMNPLEREVTWK